MPRVFFFSGKQGVVASMLCALLVAAACKPAAKELPAAQVSSKKAIETEKKESDQGGPEDSFVGRSIYRIAQSPLENHAFMGTELRERLEKSPFNGKFLGARLRVISYHPRKCRLRAEMRGVRRIPSGSAKNRILLASSEGLALPKKQSSALIQDFLQDFGGVDFLVSDVYLLKMAAFGISKRKEEYLPGHPHFLAPKETSLAKQYWEAPVKNICVMQAADAPMNFASIRLGDTPLRVMISVGQKLSDYEQAIDDWPSRTKRALERCTLAAPNDREDFYNWPALRSNIAFGGMGRPFEDNSLNTRQLGLNCEPRVPVFRRFGMIAYIEARDGEKPAIPRVRDSWSRFGFPRPSHGKQLRVPYVWSLVNTENMQTLALGNLVSVRE